MGTGSKKRKRQQPGAESDLSNVSTEENAKRRAVGLKDWSGLVKEPHQSAAGASASMSLAVAQAQGPNTVLATGKEEEAAHADPSQEATGTTNATNWGNCQSQGRGHGGFAGVSVAVGDVVSADHNVTGRVTRSPARRQQMMVLALEAARMDATKEVRIQGLRERKRDRDRGLQTPRKPSAESGDAVGVGVSRSRGEATQGRVYRNGDGGGGGGGSGSGDSDTTTPQGVPAPSRTGREPWLGGQKRSQVKKKTVHIEVEEGQGANLNAKRENRGSKGQRTGEATNASTSRVTKSQAAQQRAANKTMPTGERRNARGASKTRSDLLREPTPTANVCHSSSASGAPAAGSQATASQSNAGTRSLQPSEAGNEQQMLEQASNAYLCQSGRTVAISDSIDSFDSIDSTEGTDSFHRTDRNSGGDKVEDVDEHVTPLPGPDAGDGRRARFRIAKCHQDAVPSATLMEDIGRGGRRGCMKSKPTLRGNQRPNPTPGSRVNAETKAKKKTMTRPTKTLARTGERPTSTTKPVDRAMDVADNDTHRDVLQTQSEKAEQAKNETKMMTTKQARQSSCSCPRPCPHQRPTPSPRPSADADANPRQLGLQAQGTDDALQADARANGDRDNLPDQPAPTASSDCSERPSASTVTLQMQGGAVTTGEKSFASLATASHGAPRMYSDEQQWGIRITPPSALLPVPNLDPPPLPSPNPLAIQEPQTVPAPKRVWSPRPWSLPPPPPSLSHDAGLGFRGTWPVEKYSVATSEGTAAENSQGAVLPSGTTQRASATTHDNTGAKANALAARNGQIGINQDARTQTPPSQARGAPPRRAQRQAPPVSVPAPIRSAHAPTLAQLVISAGNVPGHNSHQPPEQPSQEQQVSARVSLTNPIRNAPSAGQGIIQTTRPRDVFPENMVARSVNGVRCLMELSQGTKSSPIMSVHTLLVLAVPWLDYESGQSQFSWQRGDKAQMNNYIETVLAADKGLHEGMGLGLDVLKTWMWTWLDWWTEYEGFGARFKDGAWPEPDANGVL